MVMSCACSCARRRSTPRSGSGAPRNRRRPRRRSIRAVLEHREDIGHPEPELAVDVAWRMVYCTIARRITHGPKFESPRAVSDKKLVRELARALADYLL